MHGIIFGLAIVFGLCLFFLPTIMAMTRDRKSVALPLNEPDTWNFDPATLNDRSVESKDHWVLG